MFHMDFDDYYEYDDDRATDWELGWMWDFFNDDFGSFDPRYDDTDPPCIVCGKKMKAAIACCGCSDIYCRQDARQNVHLVRMEANEVDDMILYSCNHGCDPFPEYACLNFEGCAKGNVLSLEKLCAFNIARKMWEPIFEKCDVALCARIFTLSVINSVDKLYSWLPLPTKNRIKQAVFLLGETSLELDFLLSSDYHGRDTLLRDVMIKKCVPHVSEEDEDDFSEESNDSGTDEEETC